MCEVEEDNTVAGLVSVDYGIAIVPNISLLKHFDVKVLPIVNPPHERFIYIAHINNKYMSPATHLFQDFVINYSKVHFLGDNNSLIN